MQKVVINKCHGGFGLSHKGEDLFKQLTGEDFNSFHVYRDDEALVQVVEQLGEKANDNYSDLKIVEIPDDVEWTIQEYDGMEWVAEKHRIWK